MPRPLVNTKVWRVRASSGAKRRNFHFHIALVFAPASVAQVEKVVCFHSTAQRAPCNSYRKPLSSSSENLTNTPLTRKPRRKENTRSVKVSLFSNTQRQKYPFQFEQGLGKRAALQRNNFQIKE
ncbi:MAG: hypothetical protein ACR2MG_19225 [Pyrinomonadaceae bacterium]